MFIFLERLHNEGSISKWFAWVEAIALTAALLLVGFEYKLTAVFVLGLIACILLWVTTYFSAYNFTISVLNKTNWPRWGKLAVGYPVALAIPTGSLVIVGVSVYGFILAA